MKHVHIRNCCVWVVWSIFSECREKEAGPDKIPAKVFPCVPIVLLVISRSKCATFHQVSVSPLSEMLGRNTNYHICIDTLTIRCVHLEINVHVSIEPPLFRPLKVFTVTVAILLLKSSSHHTIFIVHL